MMLKPSRTAGLGLRAQAARARAPCPVGARVGLTDHVEGAGAEMTAAASSDLADLLQVLVGQDRLMDFQALQLRQESSRPRRLGRGPMSETSDMTSSSRIGSIGGLVTCAKFCLK